MEAESDNIFCDATEIVTAGADSDHGSDHGALSLVWLPF